MQPEQIEDYAYTAEQLDLIQQANEIETLFKTPGWGRLHRFMADLVDVAQSAARSANTSNVPEAIDALREWQNKHDFLNQITLHAESLIAQRDSFAPRNELETLFLKEQLHGRDHRTDPDYTV